MNQSFALSKENHTQEPIAPEPVTPTAQEEPTKTPETPEPNDLDKIHGQAIREFATDTQALTKFRSKSEEDLMFYASYQWPAEAQKERSDHDRPTLTANRVAAFAHQVINENRMNRPQINVRPAPMDDPDAEDTAEVFDGLVRAITHTNEAKEAYDTAIFYQIVSSMGFARINTGYIDELSPDQEIKIERIKNPYAVTFPVHVIENFTWKDAPHAFIRMRMRKEEFKRKYPDKKFESGSFQSSTSADPDLSKLWDEGTDYIYLAEYFRVFETDATLYGVIQLDQNGQPVAIPDPTVPAGQSYKTEYTFAKPADESLIVYQRPSTKRVVMWYLMTQYEIIESREWPGKYIPIVPFLGREVVIKGETDWISLIRNSKDSQKSYNYWWSTLTENTGLSPKTQFMMPVASADGNRQIWEAANIANQATLFYNHMDKNGNPIPSPQQLLPSQLSPAHATLLQIAADDIKNTIGMYEANIGAQGDEKSGKAIIARASQGSAATYDFRANNELSMAYMGTIIIDLSRHIYDTARMIRIVGKDMTDKIVKVNQQIIENGKRVCFDLRKGHYDIVITTGPDFDTQRDQTLSVMASLLDKMPIVGQVGADLIMRMVDDPNAKIVADRIKRMITAQMPGVIDDGKNQGAPEQLQQQVVALGQQVQQLTQKTQQQDQLIQIQHQIINDKNLDRAMKLKEVELRAAAEAGRTAADLHKHTVDKGIELFNQRNKPAENTAASE